MSEYSHKRPVRGLTFVVMAALALGLAARPAQALEITRVLWGFDGRAVPERVNLLSVLVDNPVATPYNGDATVYQTDPTGKREGALVAQPLYVGPFGSRWVQFAVYVAGDQEDWTLELARRGHRLDAPTLAAPARVYLLYPDAVSVRAMDAKSFPEDLFPSSVSATDGLDSVLMDHAPRWEPLRRQAFVDWLRRGGTVHVFVGQDGRYPTFTGELAVLNAQAPRQRVGAGLVVRHAADEQKPGERSLAEQGFPPLTLERAQNRYYMDSMDSDILRGLARLVQPKHSWVLIYLVLVVYGALVVPVNWLMGRKGRGFRAPLIFFLACVLCTTVLLSFIGRRGYGETQRQVSVAVARQLDDGVYDVTHWTNVFMTRGGQYPLAYPGDSGIYSTAQTAETVNAVAVNGVGGRLTADIPLYSSRSFLHRGKMHGPDLGLRVVKVKPGKQPDEPRLSLVCSVGPQFPEHVIHAWALYRDRFYQMDRKGDRLSLVDVVGQQSGSFLAESQRQMEQTYFRGPSDQGDAEAPAEQTFARLERPLIAHCLGGTQESAYHFSGGTAAEDRIQLFIFAAGSGAFAEGPAGGPQTGDVLYHIDLFASEALHE